MAANTLAPVVVFLIPTSRRARNGFFPSSSSSGTKYVLPLSPSQVTTSPVGSSTP